MATPRKHWFRVADSIGDEDWDNDTLATLIRIQARLNTKWARNGLTGEEAGKITLTAGDAMAVTHRTSFARALQVLRRCTAAVSLVIHEQRASVKLEWPKWPEFQGLIARESPESRPLRKTPPQDARRKTQEEIVEAPPAPAAARPKRQRSVTPKTPCPDQLEPEQLAGLRAWAIENGIDPDSLKGEWEAMRDHWQGLAERRADWPATFRTWLRRSKRFKARDEIQNNRESAAQARERRTKEAVREAFNQMTEGQPPLLALPGGRS